MNISNELLTLVKVKVPELSSANKLTQSDLQRYFRERGKLVWATPIYSNGTYIGWYNNYTAQQMLNSKLTEGIFPTYEEALEHGLTVLIFYNL